MNERIRKLAIEADIDFFNSTDPEYYRREYCEAWTEQQQKFAELIVAECIDINKQELSFSALFERLMNKYKNHFGVEE
jgi:regulator of sirC expression with transglutaminase-like and TPR domain